ncbi:phage integrase SAM-like domain-containing protein [Alteribacillus sp. HJP-4]|uniref:phage integrase SAM-like domain-containing protein n=1 Tax=Alteribacillus sp. HJP-4 TaxID=2775394 RepID=UPI0035CD1972
MERDLTRDEITTDVFLSYTHFMLNDLKVTPVTANVRIRTIRAILRYAYQE